MNPTHLHAPIRTEMHRRVEETLDATVQVRLTSPDGRVLLHEQHLWAEPLDASISRVLADNLRRLTGSTNIQPSGNFLSQEYSALVEVRIERFDPTPEGALLLQCTWKVQPVGGGDSSPKAFRTSVPLDDPADPHPARVRAMNEALARLARTIRPAL